MLRRSCCGHYTNMVRPWYEEGTRMTPVFPPLEKLILFLISIVLKIVEKLNVIVCYVHEEIVTGIR